MHDRQADSGKKGGKGKGGREEGGDREGGREGGREIYVRGMYIRKQTEIAKYLWSEILLKGQCHEKSFQTETVGV